MNRFNTLNVALFVFALLVQTMSVRAASDTPLSVQVGAYKIDMTAGELFSEARAAEFANTIDSDHRIIWEVFVPENYDPENPPGVMTYISPTRSGNLPDEWHDVMRERNLIWIGANRSGNIQKSRLRIIFAVLGTELIRQIYATDNNRIYVSGFSGGGRTASWLVKEYPSVYRGAIFFCGVNYYEIPEDRLQIMNNNRYLLMTGSNDFNLKNTREVYSRYRRLGLDSAKFMKVQRMGHDLPDAARLHKALSYLDKEEGSIESDAD